MSIPHFHLPPPVIDRDAPLSPFERVAAFLIILGSIAAVYACGVLFGGGEVTP